MYSERKKNIEKIDAPSMRPATLAPATVGRRNRRSGRSGFAWRCSITTNATSSAAAAAKVPSVRALVQPLSPVPTMP